MSHAKIPDMSCEHGFKRSTKSRFNHRYSHPRKARTWERSPTNKNDYLNVDSPPVRLGVNANEQTPPERPLSLGGSETSGVQNSVSVGNLESHRSNKAEIKDEIIKFRTFDDQENAKNPLMFMKNIEQMCSYDASSLRVSTCITLNKLIEAY